MRPATSTQVEGEPWLKRHPSKNGAGARRQAATQVGHATYALGSNNGSLRKEA